MSHTLEPWRYSAKYEIFGPAWKENAVVADVANNSFSTEEQRANGHLIAVVPELLEALKTVIAFIPDGWEMPLGFSSVINEAQRVIAKAEGKK